MRNAVARLDDDFDFDAPKTKKTTRKPRAAVAGKKKPKGKATAFSAPALAKYAAVGMSATVALGITVNALMLQKGHHPAPLFGKAITLAPEAPKPAATTTAKLAPAKPRAAETTGTPASPPAKPVVDVATANRTMKASSDDPIGHLLDNGTIPTESRADPSKTVLGVQKALVKLHLLAKATGTMGPATKKAIEKFEKDQHMPVNGDMSRRLVKVLSAESGLKID